MTITEKIMDAVTGTKEWFAKSKERFEEARENEAIKREEMEYDKN